MSKGLSYRDAGVDIDAGDALVEAIKPFAKRTLRPEVLAGIGGFGALAEIPRHYREPVLVSGTDGVGTKLKLAFQFDRHDTVGIDLVAMSVNDVLVQGAEPRRDSRDARNVSAGRIRPRGVRGRGGREKPHHRRTYDRGGRRSARAI